MLPKALIFFAHTALSQVGEWMNQESERETRIQNTGFSELNEANCTENAQPKGELHQCRYGETKQSKLIVGARIHVEEVALYETEGAACKNRWPDEKTDQGSKHVHANRDSTTKHLHQWLDSH